MIALADDLGAGRRRHGLELGGQPLESGAGSGEKIGTACEQLELGGRVRLRVDVEQLPPGHRGQARAGMRR